MAVQESEMESLDSVLLSFFGGAILVVRCAKIEGGRQTWQRGTERAGQGWIDIMSMHAVIVGAKSRLDHVKAPSEHESCARMYASLFLYPHYRSYQIPRFGRQLTTGNQVLSRSQLRSREG